MWKHVFRAIPMIKELNKQKQKNVLQLTLWAFQCISEEKHAFFCWPFLKGHPFIGRSRISIFLLSWQLLQCEKTFSCPSIPLPPLSSAHRIQFEFSKVTDVKYLILQISYSCNQAFYNFTYWNTLLSNCWYAYNSDWTWGQFWDQPPDKVCGQSQGIT